MRLLFETKDEGRRFVNPARKENNPLCPASPHHLIPSHHTEDKYHSPFNLLAHDCVADFLVLAFSSKVLSSFCFNPNLPSSCMELEYQPPEYNA